MARTFFFLFLFCRIVGTEALNDLYLTSTNDQSHLSRKNDQNKWYLVTFWFMHPLT